MCGIVGVVSSGPPVHKPRLRRALDTLSVRGPDGQGAWWSKDGRIGLGHRRLAVTRPEAGAQPVEYDDCVAVVNGQFYGLGSEFQEQSDSHALPVLYRRHGLVSTLSKLRGEFAFLLYDKRSRELFVARDRFGIKPLFWAQRGREWWFASKPSALWAAGVEAGWCETSFFHAAATQYAPPGGSLFRGVETVRPAHFLRFKNQLTKHRYWRIPRFRTAEPSPNTLRDSLAECVELRLKKDAPTAVLLSGGVDSASVLALAAQSGRDITAYSVDFLTTDAYSEGRRAAAQAESCGVSHRKILVTPDDILRDHADSVRRVEGLAVNGHLVAKMKLARAVATDGHKVLLSGEGSDELFFGYRHFAPYFGEQVDPLQDSAGLGILTSTEPTRLSKHYPYFFQAKFALGQRICRFLGPHIEPTAAFDRLLAEQTAETALEKARESWSETALTSYILEVLGDGVEMAHSVEGRPPFLDHTLWELGLQPPNHRKTLLRESVRDLVLDEIRTQPKHPFMAPGLGDGLSKKLRKSVIEMSHPFVDRKAAVTTLDEVDELSDSARLEWEPAMLWLLSTYALQELWN